MKAFKTLRLLAVWSACLTIGCFSMILAALHLTERELYGLPPDSTTGVSFFAWLLRLQPFGLLTGGLAAYGVTRHLRKQR